MGTSVARPRAGKGGAFGAGGGARGQAQPTAADAPGVLEILPNGVIQEFFVNSTTATTLAGISYTTSS